MVGDGTTGRCGEVSGETCAAGELCRSQSLHGTVAVVSREKRRKAVPRDGRQEGACVSFPQRQSESEALLVSEGTTQGAVTHDRDRS